MPIYEFQCEQCGELTEEIKSINDDTSPICPKCKTVMTKKISRTSFRLLCKGFFQTDYPKQK